MNDPRAVALAALLKVPPDRVHFSDGWVFVESADGGELYEVVYDAEVTDATRCEA